MRMYVKSIQFLSLVLLCAGFPALAAAQQGESIGRVVISDGKVVATNAQRPIRFIERRDEIYVGDRITTDGNSFVQLRLVDSAIVRLQPNTEFVFREYAFDGPGGNQERAVMELLKGGMRTIDGLIGKESQDLYRLGTPHVAIEPLGTTYSCVVEQDTTWCGVEEGAILASNAMGSQRLGLGVPFDYMEARRGYGPTGLVQQPPALGTLLGGQHLFSGNGANNSYGPSGQPGPNSPGVTGNSTATIRGPGPANSGVQTLPGSAAFPTPAPIRVKARRVTAN